MEDNITNMNTLKEIILDQGNLVTYISLSKNLGIHINQSIGGENNAKLTVCSENELETMQKIFKVIYFQHIYSINKGSPQTDHAAFVTLNTYKDFVLCSGIIKSDCCIKRSSEEINNLQSSKQDISDQKPILTQNNSDKKPVVKAEKINDEQKVVKSESKSVNLINKEIATPQKENINKQSINRSVPQKGIAGFFNKQNGNPHKKENKQLDNAPKTNIVMEEKNVLATMDIDEHKEREIKVEVKTNQRSENNKILNQIKKNSKVDKKRKRVLHVSDSESGGESDPFGDTNAYENIPESDDEILPTPAVNNLQITTGIINPRKKRKMVDKTYMSEDGYIITKREEVYESGSDGESNAEKELVKMEVEAKSKPKEDSPKSKASKITSKKKKTPPQKGKQSLIMNFFKKN